ncbi:MAG: Ribose-5-phosphate isomerase A [Chlamydiae bacterium]|nr:Ribose-5-phosphate isomerase A [Chlamydiota bacterium]
MSKEKSKKAAALKALDWVEGGMVIGLGSGSTSHHFIHGLVEKFKQGLNVQAIASSKESEALAKAGGIPLLDQSQVATLDLTIDGADEIDSQKRLIKGAGGALVREKILASMSHEMIVIADESKLVDTLGRAPLPIEIIPFGVEATIRHLETLSLKGALRGKNAPYLTDNGNYIYDAIFSAPVENPEGLHLSLVQIPGVVDTGFFFQLAGRVVIGREDGTVMVKD